MPKLSKGARDFWSHVFGNEEPEQLEQELEIIDERSVETRRDGNQFNRPSLYVRVFEDMVNAVMEKEAHLLSDAEWDVLEVYRRFDYRTRYLLVRLVFRQPDWHALSSMDKYSTEIGEEGLADALTALCVPIKDMKFDPSSPSSPRQGTTPGAIVEAEEASGDEEFPIPPLRFSVTQTQSFLQKLSIKTSDVEIEEPVVDPSNLRFDYLFRDQTTMTVREALTRLTIPELREISRSMKIGMKMKKEALVNAMINHATGQRTLPSKSNKKPMRKDDGMIQSQLSFGQKPKRTSQMKRLREMVMEKLGPCVKINPNLYWLVARLHIIAYRGTEKPTRFCLPALLAGFKKWNFPEYQHERTAFIWPTRGDLLEYEEALYLDVEMENLPEDMTKSDNLASKMGSKTPVTPEKGAIPVEIPNNGEEFEGRVSNSIQGARHVTTLYKEYIERKWKALLARKNTGKGKTAMRAPGLERFEAGHVYTKMVHKAATAYGTLKEHHRELSIIEELLGQIYWRKGKRADWYERRALILEKYTSSDYELIKNGILQALADNFIGIISRPGLVRRLDRIQRKMKLHPEKWIKCDVALKSPSTIEFMAKRSDLKPGVKLNQNLRPMMGNVPLLTDYFQLVKSPEEVEMSDSKDPNVKVVQLASRRTLPKWTGKSSWVGFSDESVNVETYALQRYEMDGYVGFHSETRILTTIFALVFWDIIFTSIPGSFETQFQAGPLDMFEESFYFARQELFEARLREIEDGKAGEYLNRHDDLYRPKQTWCIGLSWNVCEKKQLLEIVKCLGPKTLAMVCKLFCEDYAGRASGIPDLIVWKVDESICKFVEVKGPGDSPRPNQKLWFDSLMRAGAHVEICRIIDEDAPRQRKRKHIVTPSLNKGGKKEEKCSFARAYDKVDPDDDSDHLAESQPKRRKLDMDENEHWLRVTPTIYAPPSASFRLDRTVPLDCSCSAP